MSKNAIEIQNVVKRFENATQNAVDGVSAFIPEGGFITIVGTSGSGKTTLLKMINRIREATAGAILFFGVNIRGLRLEEYRKKIGYVIQQIGLFPHMTVEENIAALDADKCAHCGICVKRCHFHAFTRDAGARKVRFDPEKCWGCGICEVACPKGAILMSQR